MNSTQTLSALLYGFIQGVTEFLPVSSSGHLALIPKFLDWKDPGVAFDLWMHVGTALAVLVYFHKKIFPLFSELKNLIIEPKATLTAERSYLINIIIATGVTGVLALSGKHLGETIGRMPLMIGLNLIIFGVFMYGADFLAHQRELLSNHEGFIQNTERMNKVLIKESILVGLFQAMAIFPGVSRSGATLSIMRMMNFKREEAASFSFILSLPIIFIGALLKAKDMEGSVNLVELLLGVGVSFLVGLATIHFFLGMIKKMGLGIFCFYRIALALVIFYFL